MDPRFYEEQRGIVQLYPGSNMTDEQREFAVAMDSYLTKIGHKTDPQPEDILIVAYSLGYRKVGN